MDKNHDFLVESPFVRSMIMNDNKYAFDIIDISGEYEGRLNFLIKVVRGISYDRLISILKKCVKESLCDTFILVFHLRDCRGGKGERFLGRKALQWLGINYPNEFVKVLQLVPVYGRWDDLFMFFPHVVLLNRMDNYFSENIDIDAFKNLQKMSVKLYASKLQDDVKKMKQGLNISLAAKWAPSENDKNDQQYDVVETLCTELGVNKKTYRKQYISPLRKYLQLIEHKLQQETLHNIDYNKVPSVALMKYFKVFKKKDEIQFNLFLKSGRIHYSTNMFPHEIVQQYDIYNTSKKNPVIENKWTHFLKNYHNIFIEKCIPILHLHPSYYKNKKTALIAISLAIFIARKSAQPFQNLLINNQKTPIFDYLNETDSLYTTLKHLLQYEKFNDISMHDVFNHILENAIKNNVSANDMPRRMIYICSLQTIKKQMSKHNLTSKSEFIQQIHNSYEKHGYIPPQIIFFNINANNVCFPVLSHQHNVGILSGYSPVILNSLIYKEHELCNCITILKKILQTNRYNLITQSIQ